MAEIIYHWESEDMTLQIFDDDKVEFEGKTDNGYQMSELFIDLINDGKIKVSLFRKSQHFHRIEYQISKYGHLSNLSDTARNCKLTSLDNKPLTFVAIAEKVKKIKSTSTETGLHDNTAGYIGKLGNGFDRDGNFGF